MTALTTEALADGLGIKPQTLRAAICRHQHYYGIRPAKLPNGRKRPALPPTPMSQPQI